MPLSCRVSDQPGLGDTYSESDRNFHDCLSHGVQYKADRFTEFLSPLPVIRSGKQTALGEVLSPKGRYLVGYLEPASLPPGAPAGKPRLIEQDPTLEAGKCQGDSRSLSGGTPNSEAGTAGRGEEERVTGDSGANVPHYSLGDGE
jgi:hypothetical protein